MADLIPHVQPGQPLSIRAAEWNAIGDAVRSIGGRRVIVGQPSIGVPNSPMMLAEVVTDFGLASDCVGDDCGDADCADYTTGMIVPLKYDGGNGRCRCWVPSGLPVRAFHLQYGSLSLAESPTNEAPKRLDRVSVYQYGGKYIVSQVLQTRLGAGSCCSCDVPCFTTSIQITIGGAYGDTAIVDLELARNGENCEWIGSGETGDVSVTSAVLTKEDWLWKLVVTVSDGPFSGTSSTATFEVMMPPDYCGPVTLGFVSETGTATWPTSVTLALGADCDPDPCETPVDPCCCYEIASLPQPFATWGDVEFDFGSSVVMTSYRIGCAACGSYFAMVWEANSDPPSSGYIAIFEVTHPNRDILTVTIYAAGTFSPIASATYSLDGDAACDDDPDFTGADNITATRTSQSGGTFPSSLSLARSTDCGGGVGGECGTAQYVWCAATGDPNPVLGVSCGDEPRTPHWVLYGGCAGGGSCASSEPGSDGSYHGEIRTVTCTGTP